MRRGWVALKLSKTELRALWSMVSEWSPAEKSFPARKAVYAKIEAAYLKNEKQPRVPQGAGGRGAYDRTT